MEASRKRPVDGPSTERWPSLWLTRFSCTLVMGRKNALISLTVFETKNEMLVHTRFGRTCNIFRVTGVIVRMPYLPLRKVRWDNSIWKSPIDGIEPAAFHSESAALTTAPRFCTTLNEDMACLWTFDKKLIRDGRSKLVNAPTSRPIGRGADDAGQRKGCFIGLASDDVTKHRNAWQRGKLVLNKDRAPYKSMLCEKSENQFCRLLRRLLRCDIALASPMAIVRRNDFGCVHEVASRS